VIVTSQEGRPEQRNLNDSAALAAKVARKAEAKTREEEAAALANHKKPVARKKTNNSKETENLDDLLSAGLPKKGKKR